MPGSSGMRSAISARPTERCLTGRPPHSVPSAARARSVGGSQTERLCGLDYYGHYVEPPDGLVQKRAPAFRVPHSFKFFQLAVRQSGRARRSAGAGACTGAGAASTDSAGAHGPLRRRRADRAVGIPRRPARIRLVLITNHIAAHVPALVGGRATRSRACSGSLCIGDPGDCH
jgi:hypothetical protein